MKKLWILIFSISFVGCTSNLDRPIADEKAYVYLEKICKKADNESCKKLRDAIQMIELAKTQGSDGYAYIIVTYKKPYNKLTFRDILNTE